VLAQRAIGVELDAREDVAVLHFLEFEHLHARLVEEDFLGVAQARTIELEFRLGAALHAAGAGAAERRGDRAGGERRGGEEGEGDLGEDGDLYQEALEVLKATKRASTSMIQRKLRIGYNRAARIMEIMEEKGIVGPENGSSPREILVDLDSL